MNLPQCAICSDRGTELLKVKRVWICPRNDCALAYYQQRGWLTTNKPLKRGRPRLRSYTSETERKAHYRQKTRDKITLTYYFKKKIISKKGQLANQ